MLVLERLYWREMEIYKIVEVMDSEVLLERWVRVES